MKPCTPSATRAACSRHAAMISASRGSFMGREDRTGNREPEMKTCSCPCSLLGTVFVLLQPESLAFRHHRLQVCPGVALALGRAQKEGRVIGRHELDALERVPAAAQRAEGRARAQKGLRRELAERDD